VIIFALQVCPIDVTAGLDLVQLVCSLQPARADHEWLISYRLDTPFDRIANMERLLSTKFAKVHTFRAAKFANGWPAGSNALWASTMLYVAELAQNGETNAQGVLTFEADCCPMRKDWMAILEGAYARRSRPVVGHLHQCHIPDHINGNAIFPVDFVKIYPQMLETPATDAWDFYHRELLLPLTEDTPYITQLYARKLLLLEEWRTLLKAGLRPALLHGVKDGSARAFARALLVGNKILAPPRRLVVQP
jgi:hypothetical protein